MSLDKVRKIFHLPGLTRFTSNDVSIIGSCGEGRIPADLVDIILFVHFLITVQTDLVTGITNY